MDRAASIFGSAVVVPGVGPWVRLIEFHKVEIEFRSHLVQHPSNSVVLPVRRQHELNREAPARTRRDEGDRNATLTHLTVRNHDMLAVRIDDTFNPRAL